MEYSALQPVAKAVHGRLNVASLKAAVPTGAGCVGGVLDGVPQAPMFPFLWYEVSERDIGGLGQGPTVKQVELRLHVFTKYQGMVEAQWIMSHAIALLQYQAPTATGWSIVPIGRPHDAVPLPFEEINGVAVRELVTIWDVFAYEEAA